MVLNLNLLHEGEKYKEFPGRNIDQMPVLLASGRVPISVKKLMERRLEVRGVDFGSQYQGTAHEASVETVLNAIWTNSVDTGDGVLYHPNRRIRVVTDADFLRKLTPQSKIQNGAVILDDDAWNNAKDAPTFTRDQVAKDRFGTVWLALARDDKALLDEYRKAVTAELKTRHNYTGENMKVWLANAQKVTTGRLWYVDWSYGGSNANGDLNFDFNNGRFLGVAPEAQGVVGARSASSNLSLEDAILVSIDKALAAQDRPDPLTKEYFRPYIRNVLDRKQ